MSWSGTLYPSFADQAESIATLAGAGITVPGTLDPLGTFVALVAPITEWETPPGGTDDDPVPGVPLPGFWTMLRLDVDWDGYAAAMDALQPYLQTRDRPDHVFAGDGDD